MTVIDLLIIGVIGYALVVFAGIRKYLTIPRTRFGLGGIVVGLSLVALFYLADLLTMYVLPLFLPMAKAMALMQDLHLNHQWLVALLGVGSIALGLAAASRGTAALVENLERSRTDLQEELCLRRELEQTRQDSEEQFRAVVNNSPTKIHIKDVEGRYVLVNREAEILFGVSDEEAKGKTTAEIFPRDQAKSFVAHDRAVLETGQTIEQEEEWLRDDGIRTYLTVKFPILDGAGNITAVGAIGTDITERKRIEEALREKQATLAKAQRLAKIGNWRWSIERHELISCSEEFARIHGVSMDEVQEHLNEQMARVIHPEDRDRVAAEFKHVDEGGVDYEIEYRIVRPDGEVRHVREIGEPTKRDASGRAVDQVGTIQDITERKQAEEEAQEAQERLEEALEAMAEGFVIFDAQDRLVQWNSKYRECFAELSDLLESKPTFDEWARACVEHDLVGPAVGDLDEWLANRMGKHRECSGPYELEHRDGRWFSISEYKTKTGCTAGLRIDITERKRAEAALLASGQALQERIAQLEEAQRKLEMQGESLVRLADDLLMARDEARAADRAKSEFLANMSHELRTPLNAIIGFSDIIKNERIGPVGSTKYREYADDINESGLHLLALINDILDLSKIESGTDELHEENIVILETANTIMKLVMGLARTGNVELELDVPDDIPRLHADERKVTQILLNLLSNAIKFTPGGGKVTLVIWSRAESGHVFQIVDTGIGIALENIPMALAPFQQIDGDLNRMHEGTGLGLPLTKSLVEMHGGCLDLQSEIGVGTTVTVRFPAERIVSWPRDAKSIDTAAKKAG